MRWGVAAGIVVAAAVWGRDGAVEERVKAGAGANAEADANAKADASASASASASAEVEAAVVGGDEAVAVAVAGDLEIYVVRATRQASHGPLVFLTGSCTHPLTYVNAFGHAAAEHGGLVALQGDLPCKADPSLRRWSPDTIATSARIDAALLAADVHSTTDITLIGYSQGAERAEWLARRFPAKYTRFVLMAGPVVPAAARFAGARAMALLAGHGDVRDNMADGARRLRRANIPATYIELPGTHHGELSPAADAFVSQALDWLDANAIPTDAALANASITTPRARGAPPKHRAH